jgi:antitoxin component HigA of HigAB toxin-antitoxin module
MAKPNLSIHAIPTTFEELCRQLFWPRPLHDDVDYHNAAEVVDRLAMLKRRNKDQEDYLEAISTFIEKYDKELLDEHDTADAVETLRFLMEGHDMNASDLGRVLGNRSLGAAILRRDRTISNANAIKLGEHFGVSPSLFLGL